VTFQDVPILGTPHARRCTIFGQFVVLVVVVVGGGGGGGGGLLNH